MELNFTPVRTARNYGINSITLNLEDIKSAKNNNFCKKNLQKLENFPNFEFLGENIELEDNCLLSNTNFLCNELKDEAEKFSNFKKTAKIYKSSDKLVKFRFNLDTNGSNLIDTFNLTIEEDVNSKIIVEFISKEKLACYQNLNFKINAKNGSNAEIIFVFDLFDSSTNLVSIQSEVEKNAKLSVFIVDFACKNSIFNYNSKLIGENSESNLNSLYLSGEGSTIDLNYLIELYKPNCKTNMEVIGAISNQSKKHFKGTIDFKKGCKKSRGNENEYCMVLSKNAKAKALPMMLCEEEDVEGTHSTSIGIVDEKELFYIMSRGLSRTQAIRLIVKAKFNSMILSIFDEELRNKIIEYIDRKIIWDL